MMIKLNKTRWYFAMFNFHELWNLFRYDSSDISHGGNSSNCSSELHHLIRENNVVLYTSGFVDIVTQTQYNLSQTAHFPYNCRITSSMVWYRKYLAVQKVEKNIKSLRITENKNSMRNVIAGNVCIALSTMLWDLTTEPGSMWNHDELHSISQYTSLVSSTIHWKAESISWCQ